MDKEIINFFADEALDIFEKWESLCLILEDHHNAENMNELFRYAHNLKGSSMSVGLDEFGAFVHKVEDLIVLIQSGKLKLTKDDVGLFLEAHSIMSKWLDDARTNPEVKPHYRPLIAKIKIRMGEEVQDVSEVLEKNEDKVKEIKKNVDSIRLSSEKVDNVIKLISEISIQQNIIGHTLEELEIKNTKFLNALYLNTKLVRDLQAASLSLRMQPIAPLFQKLERVGRDIAKELGKEIQFVFEGKDVELDKIVLERVGDPLVHILRNAVDHGIETLEQRLDSGKSFQAKIVVSAFQEASEIQLIIRDDGRGVNQTRVLNKAIEKGLVSPGEKLTSEQINGLIMLPGFSTAEKVTNISGRGVGMDVVKGAVEDLGGHIKITSNEGEGTLFFISLPTDLSIIDALIVSIAGNEFAVPVAQVDEVIDLVVAEKIQASQHQKSLKLRGMIVPIEDSREYLNIPHLANDKSIAQRTALIVKVNGVKVCFTIDNVIDKQTIVVRPIPKQMEKLKCFAGSTVLGNGEPSFIIDMNYLAKAYHRHLKKMNYESGESA
jgi:two-component system chemotaxis sensor kinase CheA